jgi:hypothetical protein
MKSNSQPSTQPFETDAEFPKSTTRTKNKFFGALINSKKVTEKVSKESPITKKLQELKYKFLMKNDGRADSQIEIRPKPKQGNTFQFLNINPILAKENAINRRMEPNPSLSSRIKSDTIRKKFNDIYLNKTPALKTNENLKIIQTIKENIVKTNECSQGNS